MRNFELPHLRCLNSNVLKKINSLLYRQLENSNFEVANIQLAVVCTKLSKEGSEELVKGRDDSM